MSRADDKSSSSGAWSHKENLVDCVPFKYIQEFKLWCFFLLIVVSCFQAVLCTSTRSPLLQTVLSVKVQSTTLYFFSLSLNFQHQFIYSPTSLSASTQSIIKSVIFQQRNQYLKAQSMLWLQRFNPSCVTLSLIVDLTQWCWNQNRAKSTSCDWCKWGFKQITDRLWTFTGYYYFSLYSIFLFLPYWRWCTLYFPTLFSFLLLFPAPRQ